MRSKPFLSDTKWAGQRVGILGGSFNPPHQGHIHISLIAKRMLGLDYIWWLVTPQNPLKDSKETRSYDERFAACLDITKTHPHIIVSDFEQRMQLTYTYETVLALTDSYPHTDFVLLMGMDNALSFHKWDNWRNILDKMATAHIARPPFWSMIEACPLKNLATQKHIFVNRGLKAKLKPHISYWIMQNMMMDISSTEIRAESNI